MRTREILIHVRVMITCDHVLNAERDGGLNSGTGGLCAYNYAWALSQQCGLRKSMALIAVVQVYTQLGPRYLAPAPQALQEKTPGPKVAFARGADCTSLRALASNSVYRPCATLVKQTEEGGRTLISEGGDLSLPSHSAVPVERHRTEPARWGELRASSRCTRAACIYSHTLIPRCPTSNLCQPCLNPSKLEACS